MYYLTDNTDLITNLINQYTRIFSSYFSQFLNWGKWLFYSFATIAIVWHCLWRAFDEDSAAESMPIFLKEFFLIAFFYTVMINAAPWLSSIVDTAQSMGQQLTHQLIDPASIIQQGLTIANLILAPIRNSGASNLTIGAAIVTVTYFIILAGFIAVALNLTITLLMTTFFISLAGMSLAFGSFSVTRSIARRTLDTVIAYSFKLLTLYLVISAGAGVFTELASYLPTDTVSTFDIYGWTIAATLLFWLSAHCLPKQVAKIFTDAIQQHHEYHSSKNGLLRAEAPPFQAQMTENPLLLGAILDHSPMSTHFQSKPRGYHEDI